jgi:hypothetical protein
MLGWLVAFGAARATCGPRRLSGLKLTKVSLNGISGGSLKACVGLQGDLDILGGSLMLPVLLELADCDNILSIFLSLGLRHLENVQLAYLNRGSCLTVRSKRRKRNGS